MGFGAFTSQKTARELDFAEESRAGKALILRTNKNLYRIQTVAPPGEGVVGEAN